MSSFEAEGDLDGVDGLSEEVQTVESLESTAIQPTEWRNAIRIKSSA